MVFDLWSLYFVEGVDGVGSVRCYIDYIGISIFIIVLSVMKENYRVLKIELLVVFVMSCSN